VSFAVAEGAGELLAELSVSGHCGKRGDSLLPTPGEHASGPFAMTSWPRFSLGALFNDLTFDSPSWVPPHDSKRRLTRMRGRINAESKTPRSMR
jgi:hypothetical protein